uniref:Aspartic peptidase DDI1-type domain-containing protein n=1 Tax=Nicotiana tabacum TaxID=4097 RepID=A0A1S4DGK4_TOBAC|nr:PREDICTED: uncharacterized protein LOC107829456 [Nicotiana tabacum]
MGSQHASFKNLEIQVSQLATIIFEKIHGPLPSNTEKNSKEHVKIITLRSGKNLDDPYPDKEGKLKEDQAQNQTVDNSKKRAEFETKKMSAQESNENTNALTQMPSYAKFLKEILSSKRIKRTSVVKLTEKYSAILQNKFPQKFGDPCSFTIPCTVGGTHFEKALCDFGASINLMPFSIFQKSKLGDIKNTVVFLQLANQSTKKAKGIIENVLVRVDKFVFPVDFIVMKIEENTDIPLILGKPFLATGRAIIDVHQGQLILRVDEEKVIFDMQKMMRYPDDDSSSSYFTIDLLNDLAD